MGRAEIRRFQALSKNIHSGEKIGDKKRLPPEGISEVDISYFGVQAYWGITKHMGGLRATRELAELCHISEDKYVLDVGCGIGGTPCYVAKRYGCRVVGADISEEMVDRSRERAKREGVEDMVKFRAADAQDLPFEDALFDAVIGESVTTFVKDKQRATSEYVRVTKPGGYVGLNECIWIGMPPPELVEYMSRTMGGEFLTSDDWKKLLEGSGLRDIVVRTYKVRAMHQFAEEIRQIYFRDFMGAWSRFFSLSVRSPAFRKYVRELVPPLTVIKDVFKYLGYGIYVGRK